ncbi:hypothetical protein OC845_005987 [Tilletia horrida]|nr:hypothetical protein OC845_005987 [Tilletia horrida]
MSTANTTMLTGHHHLAGPFFVKPDQSQDASSGSLSSRSSVSSIMGLSTATETSTDEQQQQQQQQQHPDVIPQSWYATSPPNMRGRIAIPQTPTSMRRMMSESTPGLTSSASNTPAAAGIYEMPWTPVHPALNRTLPGGFQLQHIEGKPFPTGPDLSSPVSMSYPMPGHLVQSSFDGGIGMTRIASAPLPIGSQVFETPLPMTIDLPMSVGPAVYTPETYNAWQHPDGYFTGPLTTMSRSMTEVTAGPSISPMVIMERSLSSSTSMPSLRSPESDFLANTPSAGGKVSRKRQRRTRDPPEISNEQNKPHECDMCKRRFIRLEHLKRHWKTHSNERPYSCPWPGCTKAFGRTDNRDQHVKTHAKGDPLKRSYAQLMALTKGEDGGRNDPHNAARSSAVAAMEASRHKRSVAGLEGPIALTENNNNNNGGLSPASLATRRLAARPATNDENAPHHSLPSSPNKLLFREHSGSLSPPLQIRNQANIVSSSSNNNPLTDGPMHPQNVDPFAASYQHHFGDNSTMASAGAAVASQGSFIGQPLLYTINENELQFVASGGVASYPLTPAMNGNGPQCEPPFLYSPSALGLTNVQQMSAGSNGGAHLHAQANGLVSPSVSQELHHHHQHHHHPSQHSQVSAMS